MLYKQALDITKWIKDNITNEDLVAGGTGALGGGILGYLLSKEYAENATALDRLTHILAGAGIGGAGALGALKGYIALKRPKKVPYPEQKPDKPTEDKTDAKKSDPVPVVPLSLESYKEDVKPKPGEVYVISDRDTYKSELRSLNPNYYAAWRWDDATPDWLKRKNKLNKDRNSSRTKEQPKAEENDTVRPKIIDARGFIKVHK